MCGRRVMQPFQGWRSLLRSYPGWPRRLGNPGLEDSILSGLGQAVFLRPRASRARGSPGTGRPAPAPSDGGRSAGIFSRGSRAGLWKAKIHPLSSLAIRLWRLREICGHPVLYGVRRQSGAATALSSARGARAFDKSSCVRKRCRRSALPPQSIEVQPGAATGRF